MKQTQQFFINILSDHLHGTKTEIPCDVDWDEILKLSKSHQVEGIVYHQCKNFMPLEIKQFMDNRTSSTLYYYGNRKAALNEVEKELRKREIAYVVVKGFCVAEYYPIPALRTMGDCDIIVHRIDMPATMNVMRYLGYEGIENDKADAWECIRNRITFELHDRLVSEADLLKPYQEQFINDYDVHAVNGMLDWNFHFLFLIVHLRKHFMNSGVGIRLFMDLAVIIQKCNDLNWIEIEKMLSYLGLLRFAKSCFVLVKKWFGINTPINSNPDSMDCEFYEQVTEKVLRNGIFGDGDIENMGNYARNFLITSNGWMMFRRGKYVLMNMFPSYEYMRTYPGCGYLDDHPHWLIFAWGQRMYNFAKRKDKNTIGRIIKRAFSDKESINLQKEFLEKMGL